VLGLQEALPLEVAPLAVVEPRRGQIGMDLVDGRVADRGDDLSSERLAAIASLTL